MLRQEDIKKDSTVNGIERGQSVSIDPVGHNALTVYYRAADGRLKEQILFRSGRLRTEATFNVARVV